MPRMQPADVAEFLDQPHVGVLATLRRDGLPYTVPIWFLHDDGRFWISGTYERVWCRQLFADPRASLCVEALSPEAGRDAFFANMQTEHRLLFELVPAVTRAIDMRVYRGKRADREYQAGTAGQE